MTSLILILSSLLTLASSHALIGKPNNYKSRNISEPTLPMGFTIRHETISENELDKRQTVINRPVTQGTYRRFLVNFSLGTPPQNIEATLDFRYCGTFIGEELPYNTPKFGSETFIPELSRTYQQKSKPLLYNPEKHPGEWGTWGMDKLTIGEQVIEEFRFLGMSSTWSLLGLGRQGSEYRTQFKSQEDRTNIFSQLKLHGNATRYAYSIWIGRNKPDARGVLFLNAVDFSYISGRTILFRMLDTPHNDGFFIKLEAVKLFQPDGSGITLAETSIPIKLDFTSRISRLPAGIVERMYQELGQTGLAPLLPCELLANNKIGLEFNGVTYIMTLRSIMTPRPDRKEICEPPFYPDQRAVLGINVLSALYLVFDLDSNEVGMGFADADRRKTENIFTISTTIPGRRNDFYSDVSCKNTISVQPYTSYVYVDKDGAKTTATETIA